MVALPYGEVPSDDQYEKDDFDKKDEIDKC